MVLSLRPQKLQDRPRRPVGAWVTETDKKSSPEEKLSPTAQKRAKIDEAIRADPHKSDRQIAKETVKLWGLVHE